MLVISFYFYYLFHTYFFVVYYDEGQLKEQSSIKLNLLHRGVYFTSNVISERSFSTLKIKNKDEIYHTLNHSIFLYVYQEISNLTVVRWTQSLLLGKTRGKSGPDCYRFYYMRVDTLLDGR